MDEETELAREFASLQLGASAKITPKVDIQSKPLDLYRAHLAKLVSDAVSCDAALVYDAISFPREGATGDFEVMLARLRLKGVDLKTLAVDIAKKIATSHLFSNPPFPDGLHLKFYYEPGPLPRLLIPYIKARGFSYGKVENGSFRDPSLASVESKRVLVEFSSPAIGKDFDGNHLRSTVLGNFVSNLYQHMGWDVVRLNYLGDWGKQIGVLAAALRRYGSDELLESDPLGHIHDVYDKVREPLKHELEATRHAREEGEPIQVAEEGSILAERDAFFKKLENGEPSANELCARIRDCTLDSLKPAYESFDYPFDEYCGESRVKAGTIAEIGEKFKELGLYEEQDGAWIVDFEKHGATELGLEKLRDHAGSTTYFMRHIATALERDRSYSFDRMIYVVSYRQNIYFRQVKKVLELLGRGDLAAKLEHISFGEMQGISKNLQDAYSLSRILQVCGDILRSASGKERQTSVVAGILATPGDTVSASVLATLAVSARRALAVSVDPKSMVSAEGDSALRLHACLEHLSKALTTLQTDEIKAAEPDYSCLEDEATIELLGLMARYPDIVASVYNSVEPSVILNYLLRLADSITDGVADDDEEELIGKSENGLGAEDGSDREAEGEEEESAQCQRARAELYECGEQILNAGMKLLGIPRLCGFPKV